MRTTLIISTIITCYLLTFTTGVFKSIDSLAYLKEDFNNYSKLEGYQNRLEYSKDEIVGIIAETAQRRKLDPVLSLRIAFCESSYNYKAGNPNSSASGLYMFTKGTWLEAVKKRGLDWKWEDVKNPIKNLDMFLWYYEQGRLDKWNASKKCWK